MIGHLCFCQPIRTAMLTCMKLYGTLHVQATSGIWRSRLLFLGRLADKFIAKFFTLILEQERRIVFLVSFLRLSCLESPTKMEDNRRSNDDPLVTLLPEDVISLDWAKRIGLVLFSVHRTDSKTPTQVPSCFCKAVTSLPELCCAIRNRKTRHSLDQCL